MTRIFPDAVDYKTFNYALSVAERTAIEKRLGTELLPGQKEQFQYFALIGKDDKPEGFILSASQKGEFGAIEFVFGIDTNLNIVDIYVQRSRERNRDFKKRVFLDKFKGKKLTDEELIRTFITPESSFGMKAMVAGVLKEMITFDVIDKDKK